MGFFETLKKNNVEFINTWIVIAIWQILMNCHFSINIQRMNSFLNGPKTRMESKTKSLYMWRGNRIHILNCKTTTTKRGIICYCPGFHHFEHIVLVSIKIACTVRWPRKRLWKIRLYLHTCVVETTYIS